MYIPENGSYVDLGYGFSWRVEIDSIDTYQVRCWMQTTHNGYLSVANFSLYVDNQLIETEDTYYLPNGSSFDFQLPQQSCTGTKTIKVVLDIAERANLPSEYGFYDDICDVAKTSTLERTVTFQDNSEPDDVPEDISITLNANGGIFESTGQEILFIGDINSVTSVEIPVMDSYVFCGFTSEIDGGDKPIDSEGVVLYKEEFVETYSGAVLYAQWEKQSYTTVLDANGGTFRSTGSETVQVPDLKIGEYVEVPVRQGYTFLGFSIYEDDEKCYIDETGCVLASDIMDYNTLYAVWEQNTSTNPWEQVDEDAQACQAYVDDNRIIHARNFRIHDNDTVIIDSLGDVYAKSFALGDAMKMSAEGIVMPGFELIR